MENSAAKPTPSDSVLGILAARFRETRDESQRTAITQEYARVVTQLIESGNWKEIPALEDQLPDERLPEAFFEYWMLR
jgi:hypothetical protein